MTDHDPLCPYGNDERGGCRCDLIRRVRRDEVEQASVVIANLTTEMADKLQEASR